MEEALGLETNMKKKKDLKRRDKKAFGIISISLDETNFAYVISCKETTHA